MENILAMAVAQGELDASCGIYAIVNAAIAVHGKNSFNQKKQLAAAVEARAFLAEELQHVMDNGLTLEQLLQMFHHMPTVNSVVHFELCIFAVDTAVKWFRKASHLLDASATMIRTQNPTLTPCLIIGTSGRFNHWTVVTDVNLTRRGRKHSGSLRVLDGKNAFYPYKSCDVEGGNKDMICLGMDAILVVPH